MSARPSARLSVHLEQLGYHCTDSHEIIIIFFFFHWHYSPLWAVPC
jgi:hypothetical protein